MRFIVGLALLAVVVGALLLIDSSGDPYRQEANLALWEAFLYVAGGIFLVWFVVQLAKTPVEGIPVQIVEANVERKPTMKAKSNTQALAKDDRQSIEQAILETNSLIAKALKKQSEILDRIKESRTDGKPT